MGKAVPWRRVARLRRMISHEALNKIDSKKRGAFGILPVLCPAKIAGKGMKSGKKEAFPSSRFTLREGQGTAAYASAR